MLTALNLDNSTSLSRDDVTIYYKLKYGFKNLLKENPDRFTKHKNADAKVLIAHTDENDNIRGVFWISVKCIC